MLACLTQYPRLYVQEVAEELGLTEDVASKNLRLLESGGFLKCEAVSKYLYYCLVKPDALLGAVLHELRHQKKDTEESVIRMVTALTHERRILLITILKERSPMGLAELLSHAEISEVAGRRHVNKLVRRGWVEFDQKTCRLLESKNRLGAKLMNIV